MKIEDKRYVLMKTGNMDIGEETVYFSNCDEKFTNDIRNALKYVNRTSALWERTDYEQRENSNIDSGLQVVPLKITYEW